MVINTVSSSIVRDILAFAAEEFADVILRQIEEDSRAKVNCGFCEIDLWITHILKTRGIYQTLLYAPKPLSLFGQLSSDGPPWELLVDPLVPRLVNRMVNGTRLVVENRGMNPFSPKQLLGENPDKIVVVLHARIMAGEHAEVPCYVGKVTAYWGGKVL